MFFFFLALFFQKDTLAIVDPQKYSNNKVGIGLLSPEAEIDEASSMVNNNGDWGYVLIVIKKSERNVDRWQNVFNMLSKNHLIPIVRIATESNKDGYWEAPGESDAKEWADFLAKLYWPIKNKYVQVYNEVNRGSEWGGKADPQGYAEELSKTIRALRSKDEDFFILNSPLDLALEFEGGSFNSSDFIEKMEEAVPGIFNNLDGWASHSYPNPNFSSHPIKPGKTGIRGYLWELEKIDAYLDGKDISVFITETGWKRSSLLSEEIIADYYEVAFDEIWSDEKIVAVTPFVFNYTGSPYSNFSFKNGAEDVEEQFYEYFFRIRDLAKIKGEPEKEDEIAEFKVKMPDFFIKNVSEKIGVSFRNTGNYIWNAHDVEASINGDSVKITKVNWDQEKVFPGQTLNGTIELEALDTGNIPFSIIIKRDDILVAREFHVVGETQFAQIIRIIRALI